MWNWFTCTANDVRPIVFLPCGLSGEIELQLTVPTLGTQESQTPLSYTIGI